MGGADGSVELEPEQPLDQEQQGEEEEEELR